MPSRISVVVSATADVVVTPDPDQVTLARDRGQKYWPCTMRVADAPGETMLGETDVETDARMGFGAASAAVPATRKTTRTARMRISMGYLLGRGGDGKARTADQAPPSARVWLPPWVVSASCTFTIL
jgi:ketosteroid isomerase-like protein